MWRGPGGCRRCGALTSGMATTLGRWGCRSLSSGCPGELRYRRQVGGRPPAPAITGWRTLPPTGRATAGGRGPWVLHHGRDRAAQHAADSVSKDRAQDDRQVTPGHVYGGWRDRSGGTGCHRLLRQTTLIRTSPGSSARVPIPPGRLNRNTRALWVWRVGLKAPAPWRVSCRTRAVWISIMAVHCLSDVEPGLSPGSPARAVRAREWLQVQSCQPLTGPGRSSARGTLRESAAAVRRAALGVEKSPA